MFGFPMAKKFEDMLFILIFDRIYERGGQTHTPHGVASRGKNRCLAITQQPIARFQ